MRSSTLRRALHDPGRVAALILSVLAGPVAFLAVLETNYALTYAACEHRHEWFLHLIALVAIVIVAFAGLTAWRARTPGTTETETLDQDETTELRARFLAYAGTLSAGFFIIAILAFEIPMIVLHPCI